MIFSDVFRVVRHKKVSDENIGKSDKFRIDLYHQNGLKKLGSKEVKSQLVLTSKADEPGDDDSAKVFNPPHRESLSSQQKEPSSSPSNTNPSPPGLAVLLLTVICVVILLWPDDNSRVTWYVMVTTNHRLLAAYILGLVTMAILKT